MNDTEIDEVEVTIKSETEKAYMLQGNNGDMSWFPKSQVSFKSRIGDKAIAEIPIWLLEEKHWS